MVLFIYISMCQEAHAVSHLGVPPGITGCLARECLKASAGVNGTYVSVRLTVSSFVICSHIVPRGRCIHVEYPWICRASVALERGLSGRANPLGES